MGAKRTLIAGTRGSALALRQTNIVADAIRRAAPDLELSVKVIATKGDIDQNPIPLDTIGKGWFTKEIEQGLLERTIDIAVHSLKDMANEQPAELQIGAYLEREDARDVLITKHGESLEELREGAVIGTDSMRRQIQMRALRPNVEMKSIRGNVPTRLEKLATESYDAIILAAAGLKRLSLEKHIVRYFEPHEMIPAPGQGTLAIQMRTDDTDVERILTMINDPEAAAAAHLERSFSRKIGGGCKSPTGAYAWLENGTWKMIAMIATLDGATIVRETAEAPAENASHLGEELAVKLLDIQARHG